MQKYERDFKYEDYITSWIWYDKRDLFLKLNEWRCGICDGKATQVHHLHYKTLGNEGSKDLLAVCKKCHKDIHENNCKDEEYNFNNTKEGLNVW